MITKEIKAPSMLIVQKNCEKGESLEEHYHKGRYVQITNTKGQCVVHWKREKDYTLNVSDVLLLDGDELVSIDFLEDTTLIITLVKKEEL